MNRDYRKIAIYGRQSMEKKDSISIETQIDLCRKNIESKQLQGEIVVYKDPGYSGKNTNRPDFQKMLDAVINNEIKMIVVYKLDRISRDLKDFTNMWDTFVSHNVEFCSINESFDTSTPTGKAMLSITMVFAQMERETTQMRVKDNYYARIAKDGRWAGGPAPYGFVVSRTRDNKPTLKVNKPEMKMVKFIFEEYANKSNVSLGQICRTLAEKGYKSKRSNGSFDNITLARMLQNPIYVAADEQLYRYYKLKKIHFLNEESEWDGSHSAHLVGKRSNYNYRKYTSLEEQSIYLTNIEGVIDSRTFLRVLERLEQNEQIKSNNVMSNMKEFQGLLKCAKCGYAIKMYSKPYISCYGARTLHACDAEYHDLNFDKLRVDLGKQVQIFLDSVAMDMLRVNTLREKQQEEIKALQKQAESLMELAALGGRSARTVHEKIEKIQRQIDEKEMENYMNYRFTDRLHIQYDIPIKYSRFTDEEKKAVCQYLINKILLHENGDLEIDWKVDFREQ